MTEQTKPKPTITPHDLAEQVVTANPTGTKDEWSQDFLALVPAHGLEWFVKQQTANAIGQYVSNVEANRRKRRQKEEALRRGISVATHSPVISVRGAEGRQLMLWIDASPAQYLEAVLTEQAVVDGRGRANVVRLRLAQRMQAEPELLALATLGEVCKAIGVDPDVLGLDELSLPAGGAS
jgi:hypothetical protein